MTPRIASCLMTLLVVLAGLARVEAQVLPPTLDDVTVEGRIDGANLSFTLAFDVTTRAANQSIELLKGDLVIERLARGPAVPGAAGGGEPAGAGAVDLPGARLGYDPDNKLYTLVFASPGTRRVQVQFSVRARPISETTWRLAEFELPGADMRQVTLTADRTELELELPGAVRVDRQVEDGRLRVTALQGAQRSFHVRWKPQVTALDAELVAAANVHTIASLGAASLRLDSVFSYEIAQGRLEQLQLHLSPGLNVTAVRGQHIRDWRVVFEDAGEAGDATTAVLEVVLNRAQTGSYALQVIGETPLPALPAELAVPRIEPRGVIRTSGHLAVGTDHAVQIVVRRSAALTQIDASAMPRLVLDRSMPRPIPRERAFHFAFTAAAYDLQLALDRIVPAYDATYRMVVQVSEDEMGIDVEVELEVRDAPLREVTFDLPAGFAVVNVAGAQVDDYRVLEADAANGSATGPALRVLFKDPLLGRSAVRMRLELGGSPLDAAQRITAMSLRSAKAQRGHLVLAVDDGIRLDAPVVQGESLREVNTASVPMRIAAAQFAYRFRDVDWTLSLRPVKRPAGVRAEAFHLVSIGEGVAVTSVAFSYLITGSPIDRLEFVIDPRVENVEFIGSDVRRWDRDADNPSRWSVSLLRKVEGDYNLGLTFSQRWSPREGAPDEGTQATASLLTAAARAEGIESQTAYVAVSSPLHLRTRAALTPEAAAITSEIDRDELPGNYRLLVSAPLLRAFRCHDAPQPFAIAVEAFERGTLLSAVVEYTQIDTSVVPRAGGRAESHTRVRYRLKNAAQQFLTLSVPADVEVWTARQLEVADDVQTDASAGGERRLALVRDEATGRLMIPVPRPRDPNTPIVIEIECGQVHPDPGWGGRIELAVPHAGADSTYDEWVIRGPAEWTIETAGSASLRPEPRTVTRGDLPMLLRSVTASWAQAIQTSLSVALMPIAAVIILALLLIVRLLARRAVWDVAILAVLAVLGLLGVMATNEPSFHQRIMQPDDLTSVSLTRVIDLKAEGVTTVIARVTPQWRANLTLLTAIVLPAIALACLIGALLLPAWRRVLLALGLTGLLFTAAHIPQVTPWLGHLLTWGLPVVLMLGYGIHLLSRPRTGPLPARSESTGGGPAPVTVAMLLTAGLLTLIAGGCAGKPDIIPQLDTVAIERIEVNLTAETDAMSVDLLIEARVDKPTRISLLDAQAILLESPPRTDAMRLDRGDEGYELVLRRAGAHRLNLRLLMPLAPVDAVQTRHFRMDLPAAMAKRLTVTIPQTGIEVHAATAVRQSLHMTEEATLMDAALGPADSIELAWWPRERQRAREQTAFFATVTAVHRLDTGVISGLHELRLQVAQGQLERLRVLVPEGMTVTAIQGEAIGAWRFDSASRLLDARFTRPVGGDYHLHLLTQMPVGTLPHRTTIGPVRVLDAVRQTATIGLAPADAVFATVNHDVPALNTDDFARDARALLATLLGDRAATTPVRFAFRTDRAEDRIAVTLTAVEPELRTTENASFTISDERLVYNGELVLSITKAGVFSAQLLIPDGYDIDTLAMSEAGHWDETLVEGRRVATVHFTNRVLGDVKLQLTMSRPVAGLPPTAAAPRVEVPGVLKHTGQMVVTADRGVRLSIAQRNGVSELDPAAAGIRAAGALLFRLLRPNWSIDLAIEPIEPRVTVEALHIARVGEGLVRHVHHLRYTLHHAGVKVFDLQLPDEAAAVVIRGPRIARIEPLDEAGHWRVELTGRWFDSDGVLPLSVQYETPYNRDASLIRLRPVRAAANLQRGYVAVFSGDRVELSPQSVGASLQWSEARAVPRDFGAGDLSDAALCYRAASEDYDLTLQAIRREVAALLDADVQQVLIQTVVTEHGQTLTDVQLQLRVAGKRELEAYLPDGAEVWSLIVGGRATAPSLRTDAGGRRVTLIPLAHSAVDDVMLEVQLVYVTPATAASQWTSPRLEGPRFDLPLKNITWRLYVPEGYAYRDFDGTLDVVRERLVSPRITSYDVSAYERQVETHYRLNLAKAVEAQHQAATLAQQGQQRAARAQLESAWLYSQSDFGFNEDARVQLHKFAQEQALVGLVGNRARLRQQFGLGAAADADAPELGERFDPSAVQRLRGALSQLDTVNLDLISSRIVDAQTTATAPPTALAVSIPYRGQLLEFTRAIQVEPDALMQVSFTADQPHLAKLDRPAVWAAGLFVGLLMLLFIAPATLRHIERSRAAIANDAEVDGVLSDEAADLDTDFDAPGDDL